MYTLVTFQEDFITFVLLYCFTSHDTEFIRIAIVRWLRRLLRTIKVTVKRDQLQSGHALTAETHPRQPRLREIDTDSHAALRVYGVSLEISLY